MNSGHFKVFRDIAQTHSVSRGAAMNGISQSAASQILKHLENDIGVVLLDRSMRPLKLTPAGRLYFDASRDIVRRYEVMRAEIDSLKGELVGSVRVASIYSIGLYEMRRIREDFEEEHPQARVHLEYMHPEKVYEAVSGDQADLGLISYPTATKKLKVIPWRIEKMVLVCHPRHRLARKRTVEVNDLADQEFVSFDPDLSIRKAMDRFFRERGLLRKVVLAFDNIQMIKEALVIGSGISLLPERTVRQEVTEGRLVAHRIEAPELVRPVGIVQRRRTTLSPTAAAFLQYLQERPGD
ncbi:MAG: LysR family transcriptional regulator [Bryobacterales bacterium]|nr:LysR family transcriptional regulator [Bryobacterales bacterium]MDE0293248.1 LysR family transcriptional regulator [Bryobacterales bacterium]MDE0436396.1 LysR family transcriptional regulator [Bryobacterales bacterium]